MHITRKTRSLLNRVRKIGGQVKAIENALGAEKDFAALLQLVAAVRGAADGLMAELMEEHIRLHVLDPAEPSLAKRMAGADDVATVIRTYLK